MRADLPQVRALTGGRLHLSHGPIDVILRAWGAPAAVTAAHTAVVSRFGDILPELCAELSLLRTPIGEFDRGARHSVPSTLAGEGQGGGDCRTSEVGRPPTPNPSPQGGGESGRICGEGGASHRPSPCSLVGRRMAAACQPFADVFLTPMAAVAGSVADELMAHMLGAAELERAYVNDGGDIAVHCAPGMALDIGVAGSFDRGPVPQMNGRLHIRHNDGVGGIATSGARGRSFSLGIADSVTVLAADAATADVAATLIANAVDIDHPAIVRRPASALDPDSDLGDRLVTASVGELPRSAVLGALEAGRRRAADYLARGLIVDAALMLQGQTASLFAGSVLGVGGSSGSEDPTLAGRASNSLDLRLTQPTAMTQGIGPSGTQNAGRVVTEGISL